MSAQLINGMRRVDVHAEIGRLCNQGTIELLPGTPEHFNDWSVLLLELGIYYRREAEKPGSQEVAGLRSFREIAEYKLGLQPHHVLWFKHSCEDYLRWKRQRAEA